jgi:hypothetical protein
MPLQGNGVIANLWMEKAARDCLFRCVARDACSQMVPGAGLEPALRLREKGF